MKTWIVTVVTRFVIELWFVDATTAAGAMADVLLNSEIEAHEEEFQMSALEVPQSPFLIHRGYRGG